MDSRSLDAFVADSGVLAPTGPGPLDGIDLAVKDIFEVEGRTASFGHPAWRDSHEPATRTSPVVERLLAEGARVVGFTKLDQLAFSIVGDASEGTAPVNPRHEELYCGGSSSGSASAVAGSRAHVGLGTDTAGSVRIPAAVCGIHGLRPTWGSLDTTGVIPLAPSLDTVGLLAANPRALRRTLEVLGGDVGAGAESWPARILVPRDVVAELPAAQQEASDGAALEIAAATGAPIRYVEMSHLVNRDVGALLSRLQGREIWREHGPWIEAHMHELSPEIGERLGRCRSWAEEPTADQDVDLRDRRLFTEILDDVMGDDSLVVLPVLGALPRRHNTAERLRAYRAATLPLMCPASLAGLPQLTWTMPSPGGGSPQACSVGLLAPKGRDRTLVDLLETLTLDAADSSGVGPSIDP